MWLVQSTTKYSYVTSEYLLKALDLFSADPATHKHVAPGSIHNHLTKVNSCDGFATELPDRVRGETKYQAGDDQGVK